MVRVFVVTGSNKGIGKSIVKLLLQDKEEKIVYLTARNEELGLQTVKEFEQNGLKPRFHQLDITDQNSINRLRDHLQNEHLGLDVLVNNAGMAYKGSSTAPFAEQAEVTNNCNFFGTVNICEALFPILKQNGRVVLVSSFTSEMAYSGFSKELKAKFTDPNLNMEGLKLLIHDFVTAAKDNQLKDRGWVESAYATSKVGVSFMGILQQKQVDAEYPDKNILVNYCCPGIVDTGMTGGRYEGMVSPDEGADTPTYLALISVDAKEPKGQFCKLRKVVPYPPSD